MDVEGWMDILQMHRSHRVDDAPWRYVTEQTWEGGCLPEQRGFGRGWSPLFPVRAHLAQPETMVLRPHLTSRELLMMVFNGLAWEGMTSPGHTLMRGGWSQRQAAPPSP